MKERTIENCKMYEIDLIFFVAQIFLHNWIPVMWNSSYYIYCSLFFWRANCYGHKKHNSRNVC